MNDTGSRIRGIRKARRLTQRDLSTLVGIDQSTISDIERGANFSAEVLLRLCDALQTSPTLIMRGGTERDLQEAQLVACFRSLTPHQAEHLMAVAVALSPTQGVKAKG